MDNIKCEDAWEDADYECELSSSIECIICDKYFSDAIALRKVHETLKCKLCSKICKTKSGLENHMKWHLNEKPHKCEICSFAFGRTESLRKHM